METWFLDVLHFLGYKKLTTWHITWVSIGYTGQLIFGSRFLVQWIVSERKQKSVIPIAFWYLSIGGSLTMFTYAAVYLGDGPFTLGQGMGCFIYIRNLVLIGREDDEESSSENDSDSN